VALPLLFELSEVLLSYCIFFAMHVAICLHRTLVASSGECRSFSNFLLSLSFVCYACCFIVVSSDSLGRRRGIWGGAGHCGVCVLLEISRPAIRLVSTHVHVLSCIVDSGVSLGRRKGVWVGVGAVFT